MDQRIIPAIWCNGTADEAARFYADVFREGSVVEQAPGLAATVSIHGFRLSLINGGDQYAPNPSLSCILNFDPLLFGGEDQARAYLDELYERLSGGGVLMELGEYPFSPRYTWVRDRFGMTWQLMLTDPAGEPRPFILPSFMFGGTNHANAEEATEAWIALFDDTRRGALRRYEEGGPMEAGTVMFTDFTLHGTWMAAMDSGTFHDFTFTPGVSMIVSCRDQEEIDRYWAGLSAVPEAERCGWCVDRWGVSWQVVPHNIAELMADVAVREKILQMGKIDLTRL
ncbi:VOC family protein [Actinomyces naeslundii]|uniref:3-demethylubiquinone-9 3-methyltransferase domain protein n=2 Tax=Actinomyces naeslundii TaxID=1655 RepID=J3F5D1_ACTNH|nr:VOC family protein [Actinomyces naeslundii]EJN86237.1 3-demethylubiquinone-9 3-methyltransferase domain protein [Actinomyces naeslundii str. Howell 279]OMG38205.1 VOC family protein [Actinomyces naeslundii]QQC21546.1 VOC family protein [Actinomyces naeslundii]